MTHPEVKALLSSLKQLLRAKRLSYGDIAKALGLSEPTIKRIFSGEDLSLSRLSKICEIAGTSLFDLAKIAGESAEKILTLTVEQEQMLADNVPIYYFWTLLLQGMSCESIIKLHRISTTKMFKWLRVLESLTLIDILPHNKIRLLVQGTLTWQQGGPLQSKLMRYRHIEYLEALESHLEDKEVFLSSSERQVAKETLAEMISDLDFLVQKYRNRASRDEAFFPASQLMSVQWLIGVGRFQRDLDYIFTT